MENIKTFVFVHGAWHGGWCWKKVAVILRKLGHDVYTPTLTGLGERSHLLNPQIDLDTHIQDILAVFEFEDLHEVILVGHSYGGLVIAGVAEKARSRLSQLIYMDAVLPEHGKSFGNYVPTPIEELAKAYGEGWFIPPLAKLEDFGVTNENDIKWMTSRMTSHPYKSVAQPAYFSSTTDETLKKTYIHLSQTSWSSEAIEKAKNNNFTYAELLSGGHDAMVTIPEELVKTLSDLT